MSLKVTARFAAQPERAKGILYGIVSAISVTGYVLINRYVYVEYSVRPFTYAVTFMASAGLFAGLGLLFRRLKHWDVKVARATSWQLLVIGAAGSLATLLAVI